MTRPTQDILAELKALVTKWAELEIQATTERSHYYVRSVARESRTALPRLIKALEECTKQRNYILKSLHAGAKTVRTILEDIDLNDAEINRILNGTNSKD